MSPISTQDAPAKRGQETSAAHFEALGTTATVAVTRRGSLDEAVAAVRRTVAAFDEACSRFRPDSELEALNGAAGEPLAVGPLLLEAVAAALRAARLTDGDVDPTVGRALIALGYDRDFSALAHSRADRGGSARVAFTEVAGWRTVRLDEKAATIHLPRGVTLDLGATAKALAADRAAAEAADACGCEVLVSLGGDIATAGAPRDGWRVRVTDDHRDREGRGQWIALHGGGLATSSTLTRTWEMPWGPAHHLVDPATGRPAAGRWRTATVAAASCLDANSASTAAIIRADRAEQWLCSLGLPSRLVGRDGRVRHLAGWPAAGDDLA